MKELAEEAKAHAKKEKVTCSSKMHPNQLFQKDLIRQL
jgi:hypothetical protein